MGAANAFASPEEADLLLATLKPEDRPLWATAMYAGQRRGELMGLRWRDVDLIEGVLRVERSWNPETKTEGRPRPSPEPDACRSLRSWPSTRRRQVYHRRPSSFWQLAKKLVREVDKPTS